MEKKQKFAHQPEKAGSPLKIFSVLSQLPPALPRDIVPAIEGFRADHRLYHIKQNIPSKHLQCQNQYSKVIRNQDGVAPPSLLQQFIIC
jgi:hypothetical protein